MIKIIGNKRAYAGVLALVVTGVSHAQIDSQGLSAAANTSRAHLDASIVRDSGIGQPLDLLNDFYPSIEVVISDRDNIRRRSDVQEDDLRISVAPSLAYRTNIGRHKFYAAYSGLFTFHDELDQEDSESHSVAAQLGLDISRRWDLTIFGGVGESFEERGVSGGRSFGQLVPGGIDNGPDEFSFSSFGADLSYGKKSSRLVATLGFERYTSSFDNNFQGDENVAGGRDRDQDSVHFDLSYKIGAKTSIFGRVQYSETDYDRQFNSLDNEQADYLIGVRWKPANALSGTIGIGSSDRDFDDPTREGFDDTIYYANLNYQLNPFSNITVNASRNVEEPGDAVSDFFESDLIAVGWNHALTSQLALNTYVQWIDDDFNTNRRDEYFDWGVGLDYIWRPWLTAGIFYGETERDSTLATEEFDDAFYGIRFRSDLRPLLRGRSKAIEPDSFDYPASSNR